MKKEYLRTLKKIYFKIVLLPIESVGNYLMLRNFKTFIKNKIVLDIGCGEGSFTNAISKYGKKTYGIDIGKDSIKIAKFFHHSTNKLNFLIADACQLPFKKNSFDFIWCSEVIEHIKNDNKVLRQIKNVLKPGGYIYITTPCSTTLLNYKYPVSNLFKKIIPKNFWSFFGALIEGDIHLLTKRAYHVRVGYSEKKITKLLKKVGLQIVCIDYRRKTSLAKFMFEITNCLPNILSIVLIPFFSVINILTSEKDMKLKKKGLWLRIIAKKPRC
jgi:2-polyprenyl-3-methyl-5-hydroxy-6-metoxy-1,4-benzoquinol methylase